MENGPGETAGGTLIRMMYDTVAVDAGVPERRGPGLLYWVLTVALTGYVALCTTHRDNVRDADAWEHHRAIVALTQDLRNPGNPTYPGDIPSIRYSPYVLVQAALCRWTGIDPWDMLSAAAVVNTLLLCLGAWAVLAALGRAPASGLALLVMVSVYGVAPGYANSYALTDLPWHQVNPSAFAFGVVLLSWALLLHLRRRGARWWAWSPLPVMATLALLDHPMTGCLGILGLAVFSVDLRDFKASVVRSAVPIGIIVAIAAVLCLLWPWYGFKEALTTRPENSYWYNPAIAQRILAVWCAPALLLSLWCLAGRDRAAVAPLLLGGAAAVAAGLVGIAIKSPTLARIPLAGLIFFHLAIAVTAHDAGLLGRQAWIDRWKSLRSAGPGSADAALAVMAVLVISYGLVPQAMAIPREPHLARSYVAPLMGRENKQCRWRELYRDVLEPVQGREVVFADPLTSWPVPSFRGRVMTAWHFEFFVPGQWERWNDAGKFFATDSEDVRAFLLRRYEAKWLLVDEDRLNEKQAAEIIREKAVRRRAGPLVLMDANAWLN